MHYTDVIMGTIASQITSLAIVYSTVYSDAGQTKYQSSASLAFVRGIHRGPVDSPHKGPVTRKMFPFEDVIMRAGRRNVPWCDDMEILSASVELLIILNLSPPGQNGGYFADDIFRCIFVHEIICILIKMSLKFVPKGAINNDLALV